MIALSHLLVISVILTKTIVDCNTGYQFGGNQRGRLIRDSGAIIFPDSVPGSYRFNGDKQRSADLTNSISEEVSKKHKSNRNHSVNFFFYYLRKMLYISM